MAALNGNYPKTVQDWVDNYRKIWSGAEPHQEKKAILASFGAVLFSGLPQDGLIEQLKNKPKTTKKPGKNHFIIGTGTSVGKNMITLALIRLARRSGKKAIPFKPFAIDVKLKYGKTTTPARTASIDYQCLAAGVDYLPGMNPVLFIYEPQQEKPALFLMGQPANLGESFAIVQENIMDAVREAVEQLSTLNGFIVAEGSGSVADAVGTDIFHEFTSELLDADVHLVTNCNQGGGFASLVGTLELMGPRLRNRVKTLILNRFNGVMSSQEVVNFKAVIEKKYGAKNLLIIPEFPSIQYLDEDVVYYDALQEGVDKEIDFLADRMSHALNIDSIFV